MAKLTEQKRRSDHEASYRQRGKSWQGRITLGGVAYSASGATRAAAVQGINDLIARHRNGTLQSESLTVGQWLATWQRRNAANWKPGTAEVYADIVRHHIAPVIGKRPLLELGPQDIRDVRAACADRLAPATQLKVYRVLRRALWRSRPTLATSGRARDGTS